MNKAVTDVAINMQSLVDSHECPFVIIDKDYNIVAVNKAYEASYGAPGKEVIGNKCFRVSHDNTEPCDKLGEECPHKNVFDNLGPCVCTHLHCDANHNMHQVRVSAFPLRGSNGELYLGECIDDVSSFSEGDGRSERMVGESPAFTACVEQLKVAAGSDAPVLLQGETGTGKELAAEYIHKHSARSDKPFQIVDSTVITDTLFESEVFGHEKGSYTGSGGQKQGLFELAEGGTVFLDEIGDLPLTQQAKLLRVLESGTFRRVGGNHTLSCNVRIICATNTHLWEAVLAGRFREDLYYRIACLNIRLPSLRERLDDVELLAHNLVEGINRTMRCSYTLMPDAFKELRQYSYPGNVRELRNVLFIAATHSQNRQINAQLVKTALENLPQCRDAEDVIQSGIYREAGVRTPDTEASSQPADDTQPMKLKDVEAMHIEELFRQYDGNRKQVAAALGVSERTIYRKIKKLGLN